MTFRSCMDIDSDHASKLVNLSRREAEGLPLTALVVGG
jgi:hypothetical protein